VRRILGHGRTLTIPVVGTRQRRLRVARVAFHSADATAVLAYGSQGATFSLTLKLEGASWRVATKPHLDRTPGCVIAGPCPGGTTTVLFWLGLPVSSRVLGRR
jgi:hypothetical protein